MAGEDTQILSNGTVEVLTIIPSSEKLKNGNGVHKLNNNGTIGNGKVLDIVAGENGKLIRTGDKKSNSLQTKCYDPETAFGWGSYRPRWLQFFATKQSFLVVFCLTWVYQGMYSTYFVSVITTIEKLFGITSKTTGIIMAATEIGQLSSSLLFTYFYGHGPRPRWIGWGMVLFSVSAATCALPHFVFGEELIRQHLMLVSGGLNSTTPFPSNLCRFPDPPQNETLSIDDWMNGTAAFHGDSAEYCEKKQITQTKRTIVVFVIFVISFLGVGMGQTAVYTLGIPYIDDNVTSRESPLYFAITIGVRILGPALGFMLGSVCTRQYADLSVNPGITPTDPGWIGAWWLGLVLISGLLSITSIAMFAFPSRLPASRLPSKTEDFKKPSLRDFPKAVKRLLKNNILMFRTASSVLHILPIAGLYTFLPKYLESQFRLPAHNANMVAGVGGILVMGLGIVLSGVSILSWKPNARFVAAWIAFTAIVYGVGMGVLMFIGCPMNDFAGLTTTDAGITRFEPTCGTTCACDPDKFSPICGIDGKTYFSACHAGCSNYTIVDGKISTVTDCQCIGQNATIPELSSTAKLGYCDFACNAFWIYILLFSVFVFIHSTGEVGSMLLILRCVDPKDKAMALGLIQFAIGLFGNVPCPIVYGAVVDSACLVWDNTCGERGACRLYDTNVFRMFLHGTTGGIFGLAFIVDLIVWYKAGSITFGDDQTDEEGSAEEMTTLKSQDVQVVDNDYL